MGVFLVVQVFHGGRGGSASFISRFRAPPLPGLRSSLHSASRRGDRLKLLLLNYFGLKTTQSNSSNTELVRLPQLDVRWGWKCSPWWRATTQEQPSNMEWEQESLGTMQISLPDRFADWCKLKSSTQNRQLSYWQFDQAAIVDSYMVSAAWKRNHVSSMASALKRLRVFAEASR